MAIPIIIPKLGVEMTSAKLAVWELPEGAIVEAEQVVASIETDKLTNALAAPVAGYLHHLVEEGGEYAVTEVIGEIAADEAEYQSLLSGAVPTAPAHQAAAEPEAAVPARGETDCPAPANGRGLKASPLARRIARENGIDLVGLQGTGPRGSIVKRDVIAAIECGAAEKAAAVIPAPTQTVDEPMLTGTPVTMSGGVFTHVEQEHGDTFRKVKKAVPLTNIAKVTASKIYDSLHQTAQMTGIQEIDVTNMVEFRKEMVLLSEQVGYRLTYTDIFIKAIACALKEVPLLNSSLIGDEVVYWDNINIGCGIAMADGSLVSGVVHNADQLSLGGIHRRMEELVARAGENRLTMDDLSGSTFTLSNIGSFGSQSGTPILMSPEVGVVGTGAIVRKPIVRDEEIVIADTMKVSTTVDHRVVNGKPGSEFTNVLLDCLKNPKLLLLK